MTATVRGTIFVARDAGGAHHGQPRAAHTARIANRTVLRTVSLSAATLAANCFPSSIAGGLARILSAEPRMDASRAEGRGIRLSFAAT
jgi:hypothetical protein